MGAVAKSWEEISGKNNWEGLLKPLDVDLRRFIIHCGERTEAIGDTINHNKASEWYGFSQCPPEHVFSRAGLQNGNPYNYKVTKFIYARSETKSAWIGYVAVATDEGKAVLGRRDILICWRGTMLSTEWHENLVGLIPTSASDIFGSGYDPMVHSGFKAIYTTKDPVSTYNKTSARDQVLSEVRKLVDQYKDEEISITVSGHSLGGALATLNATDIVANGYNKPTDKPDQACLVTAVVFGCPRVGNQGFLNLFNGLSNLHLLRVENDGDIITEMPPEVLLIGPIHVGQYVKIKTGKSPYLKFGLYSRHDLELYLHGVAGTQGKKEFKLVVNRSISLVNKWIDALKDKLHVPAQWWTEKNKNMVQEDDGSWKVNDYVPDPPSA